MGHRARAATFALLLAGGCATAADAPSYPVFALGEHPTRCDVVEPVVPDGEVIGDVEAALEVLLAGPVGGTTSMFTTGTAGMLRSVRVEDGVAEVDFDDFSQVIPNASASCGSAALLAQLDATVTQFPGIDRAVYAFAGDRAAFYEWLQLGVPEEG